MSETTTPDVRFWFDPVCPFAWMTSKWLRMVQEQRDYTVQWRFISLRLINSHINYDEHFPPEYEAGHNAGLYLLRMCAHVHDEHGDAGVDRLYKALGERIFDTSPDAYADVAANTEDVAREALAGAGLSRDFVQYLSDDSRDGEIQASTDEAFALTGKDVGTPILDVKDGAAFFGPVISRLPAPDEAAELWDHVVGLTRFGGFAEIKRSLRELPQLRGLGVSEDDIGKTEDWHGGSRRQKK